MNRPVLFGLGDGLIVAGILLGLSAICFAFFPDVYESTALIHVQKGMPDVGSLSDERVTWTYDPYWIQTEFEKLQSKCILYPVISNLHLVQKWTCKLNGPGNLKMDLTYLWLKNRIEIRQARNSSLIEIKAWSYEAQEAADIVNDIATVYRANRLALQQEMAEKGLATYSNEVAKLELIIAGFEDRLDDPEFEPAVLLYPGELGRNKDVWKFTTAEAFRELEMQNLMKDRLNAKILQELSLMEHLKSPVRILHKATAALHANYLSSFLTFVLAVAATLAAVSGRFLIVLSSQPKCVTQLLGPGVD